MCINLFGNSSFSSEKGNKFDTSLIAHKLYSGKKYIESIREEKIHLKNNFRIKKLL